MGICPPSKPLMRTPVRDFWPLTPRPPVLPLPEPMPRPTRLELWREPGRPAIWLSFIAVTLRLLFFDDAHEMRDLGDHAANLRRILELSAAADLVQPEADQRRFLLRLAANLAADLLDRDRLAGVAHVQFLTLFRFRVDLAAARLQFRNLHAAASRDRARRILELQAVKRRPHHIVGVRRAQGLRDDVGDAHGFEHRAHRAAGDNPRAGRRRAENNAARAVMALDIVMQRAAFAQRDPHHGALGGLGRLADRFRHLARLAVAVADAALLVADDDERREREALAALHHLGDAVDVDELVDDTAGVALLALTLAALAAAAAAATPFAALTALTALSLLLSRCLCHSVSSLEFQPALAGGVGERLDAPVIEILPAIELDFLDAFRGSPLCDPLPDGFRRLDIGAGLLGAADFRLACRSRDQRHAL